MRLTRRGKRRLAVLAALISLAVTAVLLFKAGWAAQHERLLQQARARGLRAYAAGELQPALENLSYYFQHDKTDLEVNMSFADARMRLPLAGGRHLLEALDLYTTHALVVLDRAPRPDPVKTRRVLEHLLTLYGQLGMRPELMHAADRLLAMHPDHVDALAAKAELLLLERRFEDAAAVADQLIQLQPESLTWRRMALDLQSRRGMSDDEQVAICRGWEQAYACDGRFRALAGGIYLEHGRIDEAREELSRAAALGAQSQEVLERMVTLLDVLDMPELADRLLQATGLQFKSQPWVHAAAIRRRWHSGELQRAAEAIAAAQQELGPLTCDLNRLDIIVSLSLGQRERAAAALKSMLAVAPPQKKDDPDRAWGEALEAVIAGRDRAWADTIDALEFAAALNPGDAILPWLLGQQYARAGEQSSMIGAYRQAYALDPNWMAAGMAYADALLSSGRLEPAYETAREVFTRAPRHKLEPFLLYARTYLAAREAGVASSVAGIEAQLIGELVVALEQARQEFPDHPDVAALLAWAYVQADRKAQAQEVLSTAAKDSRLSVEALLELAAMAQQTGLGDADALIEQARSRAGLTPGVALAKAAVLGQAGENAQAVTLLEQAAAPLPDQDPQKLQLLAARIQRLLQFDRDSGLRELWRLVEMRPRDSVVQRFALAQPPAWSDERLITLVISNLKACLSPESMQARLAEAHLLLHRHAGEPALLARAIVQINRVVERQPDSLAALSLMADALLLGNHPNIPRAIQTLERASSLYPSEPSLLVRLIALLQDNGDFEKAGRYLRALAQLSEHRPTLRRAELALLQSQGDFETALARASRIINDRSAASEQMVLAGMLARNGDAEQAGRIYERLLAVRDPAPLVRIQAAEFFASTGKLDRALKLLESLPTPAAQRARIIATFHERFGSPDEAERWLRVAVQEDPASADAHYDLAKFLLSRQDRQQARAEALQGLKCDPRHEGLRVTLAIASLGLPGTGRVHALAQLRELAAGNDELLATLTLLEQVPVRDGRSAPTSANLATADRLVEQYPRFMPAWLLAVTLNVEAGRANEAIATARRAVGRLPRQVEPAQWATQLLTESSRWDEALVEAQEWRRRMPADPVRADLAIASILLELGRPQDARAQLEPYARQFAENIDRNPDQAALWVRTLALSGGYDQAAAFLGDRLLREPRWRELWLSLAVRLDDTQAADALSRLESAPLSGQDMLMLAAQWTALGQRAGDQAYFERAVRLARAAADDGAIAAQSLIALGAIAQASGDPAEAESLFRQALDLEPDSIAALNNLAAVLALQGDRCEEALACVQRGLASQPKQPEMLDTLGQVLICLGRPIEAESALREARRARPDDLSISLNLAEALLRQHRADEAGEILGDVEHRLVLQPHAPRDQRERLEALQKRLDSLMAAAR